MKKKKFIDPESNFDVNPENKNNNDNKKYSSENVKKLVQILEKTEKSLNSKIKKKFSKIEKKVYNNRTKNKILLDFKNNINNLSQNPSHGSSKNLNYDEFSSFHNSEKNNSFNVQNNIRNIPQNPSYVSSKDLNYDEFSSFCNSEKSNSANSEKVLDISFNTEKFNNANTKLNKKKIKIKTSKKKKVTKQPNNIFEGYQPTPKETIQTLEEKFEKKIFPSQNTANSFLNDNTGDDNNNPNRNFFFKAYFSNYFNIEKFKIWILDYFEMFFRGFLEPRAEFVRNLIGSWLTRFVEGNSYNIIRDNNRTTEEWLNNVILGMRNLLNRRIQLFLDYFSIWTIVYGGVLGFFVNIISEIYTEIYIRPASNAWFRQVFIRHNIRPTTNFIELNRQIRILNYNRFFLRRFFLRSRNIRRIPEQNRIAQSIYNNRLMRPLRTYVVNLLSRLIRFLN